MFCSAQLANFWKRFLKLFKKSYAGYKTLNNQAKSSRLKIMDSKATFQAIELNLASSTQKSIRWARYLAVVFHYLHNLSKSIQGCLIMCHITKLWQNFWFTLAYIIYHSLLHLDSLSSIIKIMSAVGALFCKSSWNSSNHY